MEPKPTWSLDDDPLSPSSRTAPPVGPDDDEADRQQRSAHEAAVNAIVCEADSWSLVMPTLRDLMWQVGQLASPGAAMYPQTIKQTLIVLGGLVLRWLEMEIAKERDLD